MAIVAFSSLTAAPLFAQTDAENLPEKPKTLEEADRLLERALALREAAEREYATEKEACYAKILVNSCLADAKDKQREATIAARKLETPAREFKREMRRINLDEKERKRAADLIRRQADEKISIDNYRAQEAAKALLREQRIADKAKQGAEGRQKSAQERTEREEKALERERKETERAAAEKLKK